MKKTILTICGVCLGVIGIGLAITNPSKNDYENYATEKITVYLKDKGCGQLTPQLKFLASSCHNLIENAKPRIKDIIAQNTQQQNYLFFSIYKTNFSFPDISSLPSYNFETLGIVQNFYLYQSEKK
ncbi:MAG TPA: DUF4359 domain-containing protein [Allocoleopsis sp.]